MIQSLFNIFLVMASYTLSRLFFYLLHLDLYPDVTPSHLFEMLGGGIRFDLTAVLYLSSLYIILSLLPLPLKIRTNRTYATVQKYTFLVPNILGILVNSADMVYFNYTQRRTTCSFFTEFSNEGNLFSIFIQAVFQYWYISLFAIAICVALFFLYLPYRPLLQLPKLKYYPLSSLLFLASCYFMVIGMRGGFGAYITPIAICDAMLYVNRPIENALVLNTPFCLMRSYGNSEYEDPHYFPDDQLEYIMSPLHTESYDTQIPGKPNIVILILEGFGSEFIGFYNHSDAGYTPFLDSLLRQSITFTHSYAAGTKSIEGCPAILSSIPSLYESYWLSDYSTNEISSIADHLNSEGYNTSFFHGAPNGSMGISAYTNNAHFRSYYGMTEYNKDPLSDRDAFDGTWAIWDEEFLQYFSRTLRRMPQPFMTAVFTATSHNPFAIPKRYEGKVKEGPSPICRCISYTDHALRLFFDSIRPQPWFSNTIFVITADHTNALVSPEYVTDEGRYRIPIAFYIPGIEPRVDSTTVISQVDIFPSLMALIGTDRPFFSFGENAITAPKTHNYAINYPDPYFQIISPHGYIQFDGTNVTNIQGDIPADEQTDMLRYLKAYIQQYVSRLIDNRMTCDPR